MQFACRASTEYSLRLVIVNTGWQEDGLGITVLGIDSFERRHGCYGSQYFQALGCRCIQHVWTAFGFRNNSSSSLNPTSWRQLSGILTFMHPYSQWPPMSINLGSSRLWLAPFRFVLQMLLLVKAFFFSNNIAISSWTVIESMLALLGDHWRIWGWS